MNATIRTAVLLLCAWLASDPGMVQSGPQKLRAIRLNAGIHNIVAELASTPDQRQIGLMMRPQMGSNEGMLFVFESVTQQCFWMKNTLIPLAIAFLEDDGSIVNIDTMRPQTLDQHCSTKPVRYALEMNEGWFAKRGIRPGHKLTGLPRAP